MAYACRSPLGGFADGGGPRAADAFSGLPALFLCPALLRSRAHLLPRVGPQPGGLARRRGGAHENFSTFALGGSIAAFIGPSAAGFAIELAGFRAAFAVLALAALLPSLYVLLHRTLIPAPVRHEAQAPAKSALDLLAIPALAAHAHHGGVALTGIELFSFYLPIYGPRDRACALDHRHDPLHLCARRFAVRMFMHRLAQRFTEVGVLTGSLFHCRRSP